MVDIADGERNYHVFYQMLTDPQIVAEWALPPAPELAILSSGGAVAAVDGVSDAKEFLVLRRALEVFGLPQSEQAGVWRVLAAVLLLGNIPFRVAGGGGGGQGEGDGEVAEIADEGRLRLSCVALGCDPGLY